LKRAAKKREASPVMLKLSDIQVRPEFQVRQAIDDDIVAEYARHLDDGGELDPIHVFENDLPPSEGSDKQPPNYLCEGFHRYKAYEKVGRTKILAFVHSGEPFEALELAIQTNCHHGHPMDRQSKYKAVKMALENTQLRRRSNKALASLCGVSPTFITRMREGKIRVTGAGPRKKAATKRAAASPSAVTTTAGDPGAHEPTAVESADDRMTTMKSWLKAGFADWPMFLDCLHQVEKKMRFIGFPKKDITVVVMQDGKFVKEMVVSDLFTKEGKVEIHLEPDDDIPF